MFLFSIFIAVIQLIVVSSSSCSNSDSEILTKVWVNLAWKDITLEEPNSKSAENGFHQSLMKSSNAKNVNLKILRSHHDELHHSGTKP